MTTIDKITQDKLWLIKWILDQNDEQSIDQLKALVDDIEYDHVSDKKVIGYAVNGLPVTKSWFMHQVKQSIDGLEKAEYLNYQDLEKVVDTW